MPSIQVVDRVSGELFQEQVYGDWAIDFVYGDTLFSRLVGRPLLHLLIKRQLVSWLFGWWQQSSWSRGKVLPFIETFHVDPDEFLLKPEEFHSFNDFFIRKLKPECRPIAASSVVMPADGRYRFFPLIEKECHFSIKGEPFSIASFLQDEELASRYVGGTMVMARLCPTDYHRFHFPLSGIPSEARLVSGHLESVNPAATEKEPAIYCRNKRMITLIESEQFGSVAFVEIGATCVGSIQQTFQPHKRVEKGEGKGTFAFGASALALLFEPETIQLAPDLLELSSKAAEIRCLVGQDLGEKR